MCADGDQRQAKKPGIGTEVPSARRLGQRCDAVESRGSMPTVSFSRGTA